MTSLLDPTIVLSALPHPVLVLDAAGMIGYANPAAEQFFHASAAALASQPISELLGADSAIFALIEQSRALGSSISEAGIALHGPRVGPRLVSIVVSLHPQEVFLARTERFFDAERHFGGEGGLPV